jgi:hypothetical protein
MLPMLAVTLLNRLVMAAVTLFGVAPIVFVPLRVVPALPAVMLGLAVVMPDLAGVVPSPPGVVPSLPGVMLGLEPSTHAQATAMDPRLKAEDDAEAWVRRAAVRSREVESPC